jgi:hypothetical protein
MKKKDWTLLGLTAVYSFLFYHEMSGLNYLIFTCCFLIAKLINSPKSLTQLNVVVVSLACIVSSACFAYYGSSLALLANWVSFLVLVGIGMNQRTSVLFALLYGLFSFVSSPVYWVINLVNRKKQDSESKVNFKKGILIGLPILIAFLFIFLYRSANPVFDEFLNQINFDWISFSWLFFTFFSLLFLYGCMSPRKGEKLALIDEVPSTTLLKESSYNPFVILGKEMFVKDEFFSGKLLFILLNCILLLVNLLDFNFIFISKTLPENMSFATFLHQGVGTLVFSILISIVIILFYFRGELNFVKESKTLKILATLWVLQNVFLLISVCVKNGMYIDYYGLTYKRIGIYVYALLTTIGLISTLFKIYQTKRNIFLVRFNGWSFFVVLIFSSLIHWDQVVVNHNLKSKGEIDFYYLLSMSDSTLPSLLELKHKIPSAIQQERFIYLFEIKLKRFQRDQKNRNWKSNVYLLSKTDQKLKNYKYINEIYRY